MDRPDSGAVGIARRTYADFRDTLSSGEAGGYAAKFGLGAILVGSIAKGYEMTFEA